MKFIYIAGKYTGDILQNVIHGALHAVFVAEIGGHPVLPHTSHPQAEDWDHAMRLCRPQLLSCGAVYLTPGWRDSAGARQEKVWAEAVGMPVFETLSELKAWVTA